MDKTVFAHTKKHPVRAERPGARGHGRERSLDDYHLITEQQVHTTLSYLVEHLPTQLRIILITRTDPPLPLSQLRARQQVLEVRTDQLRCTINEAS